MMEEIFWDSIAQKLEEAFGNVHPSKWKKKEIEIFLGDFIGTLREICNKSPKKGSLLVGGNTTFKGLNYCDSIDLSYDTFRRIFKTKEGTGTKTTMEMFSIYFGFESLKDYVYKNQLKKRLEEYFDQKQKNAASLKRTKQKDINENSSKEIELKNIKVEEKRSIDIIQRESSSRKVEDLHSIADKAFQNISFDWSANIPNLPYYFVGREKEKDRIKKNLGVFGLSSEEPLQVVTAVKGMPGIGKTTFATMLAHDQSIRSTYPDGILWTAIGQNPNLLSKLASWGDILDHVPLLEASTTKQAISALKKYLSGKKMLLILDDVWDVEAVYAIKKACNKDTSIIVTTRIPKIVNALFLEKQAICELPVLTKEQSFELLSLLAPTATELYPSKCQEILKKYQFLPLAITVAGGLLRSEFLLGFDPKEIILELLDERSFFQQKAPEALLDLGNLEIPTVYSLFRKSTSYLSEELQFLFARLHVFSPKPSKFDLEDLKVVWQMDAPKTALRELISRGLIEPIGKELFQIHPLLSSFSRELFNRKSWS